MTDIRASEIEENMRLREYGSDEDAWTVAKVDWHGDTVLVTDTEGWNVSFDRDEVVELLPPEPEPEPEPSRLILEDGKPVSSCCHALVERTCEYTDTHVFIVEEAETDEAGKIVAATYTFHKTYDGTDGTDVRYVCLRCEREIEQDDIDWREE